MRLPSQLTEYFNRHGSQNHPSRGWLNTLCVAGILCVVIGCGGGVEHDPTIPVNGTITYNGKPVESGTLMFWPSDSTKGRRATATIESDGTFTTSTFEPNDGMVPGEYNVTVDSTSGDTESAGKVDLGATRNVPEKYLTVKTTDLQISVADGQDEQSVTLKLKD